MVDVVNVVNVVDLVDVVAVALGITRPGRLGRLGMFSSTLREASGRDGGLMAGGPGAGEHRYSRMPRL